MSVKGEVDHPHLKVPNSEAIPKILRNVSLTAITVIPGLVHQLRRHLKESVHLRMHFSVVLGEQKCGYIDTQDVFGYRQDDFHPPVSRAYHGRTSKHDSG